MSEVTTKPRVVEGMYQVQSGDSLWRIHRHRLGIRMAWWRPGNAGWWPVVVTANPELRTSKGNLIFPGQRLLLLDEVVDYPMD